MIRNIVYGLNRSKWNNLYRASNSVSWSDGSSHPSHSAVHLPKRTIFTDEVLGVDRFLDARSKVQQRFGQHKEKFLERLSEHIKEEGSVVLSEDLKNLIFLCENNEQDLTLLKNVVEKFEKQNESLRYGTFQFGPVVMRLAKVFHNTDLALMPMNKKYIEFFTQLSSITIALDILYEAGRYEDVIRLFDFAIANYKFEHKYPSDFITPYFAACYKLNTLESFDKAFYLLRAVKFSSSTIKTRALSCFIALAIEQNHPNIALEIIQQVDFKFFNTVLQSLRLLAFSNINRYHDVFEIIRFKLKKDSPNNRSKLVFKDVLEKITENVNRTGKTELIDEYNKLLKNVNESSLVETNKSMAEAMDTPIGFARGRQPNQVVSSSQASAVN